MSVQWFGSLRAVLRENQLTSHFSLASLQGGADLYGLGPIKGLRGEITLLRSACFLSTVEEGHIIVNQRLEGGACFFVYAQVERWREVPLPQEVTSDTSLEQFLSAFVGPLPFLLKGRARKLHAHVINKINDAPHNPEEHDRAKVHAVYEEQDLECIGFYSKQHREVFTPPHRDIHLHFVSQDKTRSGHVDRLEFSPSSLTLHLPA
jgi:acetolactate decarboxylase